MYFFVSNRQMSKSDVSHAFACLSRASRLSSRLDRDHVLQGTFLNSREEIAQLYMLFALAAVVERFLS